MALVGLVLWSGPVLLETLGKQMSNPRADSVRAMQDILNATSRALLDNMNLSVNPRMIIPVREHKVMTATEVRRKHDDAQRRLTEAKNLNVFPELWSKKLLEDFAKDGIMGNFLKDELVGPDWPEYAGVNSECKRQYHVSIQGSALAKKIDDHMLDAVTYGLSMLSAKP